MTHIVIYHDALSGFDMRHLRDSNRENNPVIVTVVEGDGYSKRYKLSETMAEDLVADIPPQYLIRR